MKEQLIKIKNEYQNLKEKLDKIATKDYGMDEHGGFPSISKFDLYIEKNKLNLEKLKSLREQIEQLEWKLMTPEEQKAEKELIEKMKLKREGKL